jgi:hypothetical protein
METTDTWLDAPGGETRMTLRNRGEPRVNGLVSDRLARPSENACRGTFIRVLASLGSGASGLAR